MKIEFMWKDRDSYTGDCPAQYRVTEAPGGYIIQGKRVDAETRAQLQRQGP